MSQFKEKNISEKKNQQMVYKYGKNGGGDT